MSAIGELGSELKQKTDNHMMTGCQKELSCAYSDGSYGSWQQGSWRDSIGSIWLTAFVVKLYAQSDKYITIDPQRVTTSLAWMTDQQKADGSFDRVGQLYYTYNSNNLEGNVARTAFILISLLEAKKTEALSVPSVVNGTITRARAFLESQLDTLTDSYSISIAAYALALAGAPSALQAKRKLISNAITKNGATHWTNDAGSKADENDESEWLYSPHHARSADIEMTGYALLALTTLDDISNGLSVVKWLSEQRNSLGRWSSTQNPWQLMPV
eukprot:m.279850 g.279850  ORF g.279850 m.279850 type:complete len:272 (+) comp40627_c0_seq9:2798-3613(+)